MGTCPWLTLNAKAMKRQTSIRSLLLLSAVSVAQLAPTTPLTPTRSIPCPAGKACETFKQMVRGKDGDILTASWVCFYIGDNPHSKPNEYQKSHYSGPDEFFWTMDGKLLRNAAGTHPGIWVESVQAGIPQGYSGYGPKHGGLDKAHDPDFKADGETSVTTFDDLGDELRFMEFAYLEENKHNLTWYTQTRIRKSSGRFQENTFSVKSKDDSSYFSGQCLRLK
jgi:hypothetical protein